MSSDSGPATSGASQAAIEKHYDVGNSFFALWLDRCMNYSGAMWDGERDTLEAAQARKVRYHVDQSRAASARRVLDVGCGWGTVLRTLVDDYGVGQAVGLTLSSAQAQHVRALERPNISVIVEPWADHQPDEPYDAIISIGAMEHFVKPEMSSAERVEVYRRFFERCRDMLPIGGRLSLQSICYGTGAYFPHSPMSQIFPESDMPRVHELCHGFDRLLSPVVMHDDASGYARTVRIWHERLTANYGAAVELVGEQTAKDYDRYLRAVIKGFDVGVFRLIRITLENAYPVAAVE